MAIRENKYARRAREREQNSKKVIQRDPQPTPEEQLARLEEDIRRLKVEFDIYFNGAAKRPPYDTKGRVETVVKRLADERTLSFAQRYHYNSLVARYTSFLQLCRSARRGASTRPRAVTPARRRTAGSPRPAPSSARTRARTSRP